MSDFIPKVPFEVYPGLEAMLWTDTPMWVADAVLAADKSLRVAEYIATQVAVSVYGWRGEHAPPSEQWPIPVRGEGDSDALRARRTWCMDNLPVAAMQRILRAVDQRAFLRKDEVGN